MLSVLQGRLGVRIPSGMGEPELIEPCGGGDTCFSWGDLAELTVHQLGSCYQLNWRVRGLAVVEDCFGNTDCELPISNPIQI